MPKLRVHAFTISLDGYGAGPDQNPEQPLGRGGEELHGWMVNTRTFRQRFDEDGGETGVDDDFTAAGFDGIGATIMGRNMFGPVRGDWGASDWRGWWGDEPPYHAPVFVLTHYPREPIPMAGGTTFYFVDDFDSAVKKAVTAAGDRTVTIAGGASAVRQGLQRGVVDEIMLSHIPVVLGGGERLFDDVPKLQAEPIEVAASPLATHVVYRIERA